MVIIFSKIQVLSSDVLEWLKSDLWEESVLIIDKILLLLGGRYGTKVVKRDNKRSSGNLYVHLIFPWQNWTIDLFFTFYFISKSTYFLLKLNLHCKLPNFRCVSNTSKVSLYTPRHEKVAIGATTSWRRKLCCLNHDKSKWN